MSGGATNTHRQHIRTGPTAAAWVCASRVQASLPLPLCSPAVEHGGVGRLNEAVKVAGHAGKKRPALRRAAQAQLGRKENGDREKGGGRVGRVAGDDGVAGRARRRPGVGGGA